MTQNIIENAKFIEEEKKSHYIDTKQTQTQMRPWGKRFILVF